MYIIFLQFLAVFEIFYAIINGVISIFKISVAKKIAGNILSLIMIAITYGIFEYNHNLWLIILFTILSVFFVFLDGLNIINSFIKKNN